MRVGGQRHTPAALPPGKTRYPLYRRLGGLHSRSEQVRKILPPTGIRFPDRRARGESLYGLRYPGHPIHWVPELFHAGKQPGCKVNHSPPPSPEVKNEWSCTSTPPTVFMAQRGKTLPFLLWILCQE